MMKNSLNELKSSIYIMRRELIKHQNLTNGNNIMHILMIHQAFNHKLISKRVILMVMVIIINNDVNVDRINDIYNLENDSSFS